MHQKWALKHDQNLIKIIRMDFRPVPAARARWTRKSIISYLEGEQDLTWIIGVIQTSGDPDSARRFLDELRGFGDPDRRDGLVRRLEADMD